MSLPPIVSPHLMLALQNSVSRTMKGRNGDAPETGESGSSSTSPQPRRRPSRHGSPKTGFRTNGRPAGDFHIGESEPPVREEKPRLPSHWWRFSRRSASAGTTGIRGSGAEAPRAAAEDRRKGERYIFSLEITLDQLTRTVNPKGDGIGFSIQGAEKMSLRTYRRIDDWKISWNL